MKVRGFTLVELIAVVVILAVVAGALIPRVVGGRSREAEQVVGRVAELLSAAARRDAMLPEPLVIDFEGDTLRVLTLREPAQQGRTPDAAQRRWRPDPLIPQVGFDALRLEAAEVDGARQNAGRWRVELGRLERRPPIELTVADASTGRRWLVRLPAGAVSAEVLRPEQRGAGSGPRPIDLDQQGMGERPW
jgi:prepilin-type N-terminal cleavage/methylation domain-containing protein